MYIGFLKQQFLKYQNEDVNISYAFRGLYDIDTIFDIQLSFDLEVLMKQLQNDHDLSVLCKFITKVKTENLITPQRAVKIINLLNNKNCGKSQIESIPEGISQMMLMTDEKVQQSLEVLQTNIYLPIKELSLRVKENHYIVGKAFTKPSISSIKLPYAIDYFISFRDQQDKVQVIFLKNRLKAKYFEFYDKIQVQNKYRIQNFETKIFKEHLEIKVKSSTEIELVEIAPLQFITNQLIKQSANNEDVTVAAIVISIENCTRYKKVMLCTGNEDNRECLKIPLILWDDNRSLEFSPRETVILEGCVFIKYGECFELKAANYKFQVHRQPTQEGQSAWDYLEEMKQIWFQDEFIEIKQQTIEVEQEINVEKVLKIVNEENLPKLDIKSQKITKIVTVTDDNVREWQLKLVGERLANYYFEEQQIFTIDYLTINENYLITHELYSKIKVPEEYQIQQLSLNYQQKTNTPLIKIKVKQSTSTSKRPLNDTPNQLTVMTLQEGKHLNGLKFKTQVRIDKLYQISIIKNKMNQQQKRQDIVISDDTDSGPITLWNEQIGEIQVGQTILIDNIFYSESKKEFKTTQQTKITLQMLNPFISKNQIQVFPIGNVKNNLDYAQISGIITVTELLAFQDSTSQYQYCRAIITEFTPAKITLKCPNCFNQRLIQIEGIYECPGEHQNKHIVQIPKLNCFIKVKVSDFTGCLEAILCDDIINEYVSLEQMKECAKNDTDVRNYFDCLINIDLTMKFQIVHQQKEDLKRIKLLKLFNSNFKKEVQRLLEIIL